MNNECKYICRYENQELTHYVNSKNIKTPFNDVQMKKRNDKETFCGKCNRKLKIIKNNDKYIMITES